MTTTTDQEREGREVYTLPEWAAEERVKLSYAYEQHRHGRIPGAYKIGRFVRIHMPSYRQAKGIAAHPTEKPPGLIPRALHQSMAP